MWYFGPFDAHATTPAEIRVEDQWTLDATKSYSLYEFRIEGTEFSWEKVGDMTLANGFLEGTTSLHYLTTLALLQND